jgi:hypothetical protein
MQTIRELIDRHAGEDIYVLCPGTSMKGYPWETLDDQVTIAVNDTIYHYPATYHIFNDTDKDKTPRRYSPRREDWQRVDNWDNKTDTPLASVCSRPKHWWYSDRTSVVCQPGGRGFLEPLWREARNRVADRFYVYEQMGPDVQKHNKKLWCNASTTVTAVMLAWKLGAQRIYLLGYDCCKHKKGGYEYRYFYEPGCPDVSDGDDFVHAMGQLGEAKEDMEKLADWWGGNGLYNLQNVVNLSPIYENNKWPDAARKEQTA